MSKYKDDFEKLKRIEEIYKEIAELKHEVAGLENYFNNKRKVKNTIGDKEMVVSRYSDYLTRLYITRRHTAS